MTVHIKINVASLTLNAGALPAGLLDLTGLNDLLPDVAEQGNIRLPGTEWEKGWIIGGIMPAIDDHPAYYLLVPTDPSLMGVKKSFGPTNDNIEGLSDWDGKANTALLVAREKTHAAAEHCASLTVDGHNDLYLPSKREASLLQASVPHLFNKYWHWTSTQSSAITSIFQDFGDGDQGGYYKNYEFEVRPVRRVIL